MSARKVIVLSDFDGTITTTNTMDFLYQTYATCGLQFVHEWDAGKLSTMQEERLSFDCIHASREEMEEGLLAHITLDPHSSELINFCRKQGYGFMVLSEGQTWYIHHLLANHKLSVDKVFGSEVTFHQDGTVSLEYPYYDPNFPMRGTAKATVIENYRKAGFYTIFIGDGKSDTDAVRSADKVFAKSHLLEYCQVYQIPVQEFVDFKDLLKQWADRPPIN